MAIAVIVRARKVGTARSTTSDDGLRLATSSSGPRRDKAAP
jgi:hypothetical protein